MGLADYLSETQRVRGEEMCAAGRCIDMLDEEHRREYEAWTAARRAGVRGMSLTEMALAISIAAGPGLSTSDKSLSKHIKQHCLCYGTE